MTTTVKGAATRRRIVEAASTAIRERGVSATTLDDVCRRSRTGKSQLFHYFPEGREELLLAVAELEADQVFQDQQPYLGELTSRPAWERWRDVIVETSRNQGLHCPLGVLIADMSRHSPASQAVTRELIRQWQQSLRTGIEATQAAGDADPTVDADSTAAAVIAAIQGGVSVLLSTGSAAHLEAVLDLCLNQIFPGALRPSTAAGVASVPDQPASGRKVGRSGSSDRRTPTS